ncbi:hypothetical protein HBA55_11215 [Pseudomaricurvus alkylphenolicus]|uniref:hypothetical protein n=1 Tax=Pseudomaricurvus alkylphenolicus TaxID=1306991 RepID=UPI00141E5CE3|nr:hypothetical protein [Pseudomaricurvus alkylphenolicus]NIB40159.1 hypothetical protein [Pseudomaricurvus alkylphenolicus]
MDEQTHDKKRPNRASTEPPLQPRQYCTRLVIGTLVALLAVSTVIAHRYVTGQMALLKPAAVDTTLKVTASRIDSGLEDSFQAHYVPPRVCSDGYAGTSLPGCIEHRREARSRFLSAWAESQASGKQMCPPVEQAAF